MGAIGIACSSPETTHLERETVIPRPVSMIKGTGKFVFTPQTIWQVENAEQIQIAKQLTGQFETSAGFAMNVEKSVGKIKGKNVYFRTDSLLKPEAYTLTVKPKEIVITASSASGFFYATQTIRQMLPPAVENDTLQKNTEWSIPAVSICDEPRFAYRGFMLDVARCFIPKENVIKLIDYMAMLKINKLHLHLVDDQGWRLEIKSHPRLTEVGAWRVAREEEFPARKAPQKDEPTPVGGFYTQKEMKEIVAYAASKSVEVIPEIEMPAHTISSLAAYPELACPVVNRFIGVLPGFGGGKDLVYCAGNDKVFDFLQDVIDEVITIFPSSYIHIGGDEASKVNWKKCPLCQARMKTEKIANEEDLQGYFIKRINTYIRSKGKTAIGWDEITNSELPEASIVLGWRGMGNVAYKAGEKGHRYIMAPARIMYLIRYQGPQWFEPRTYFGNNTLADVYNYEPLKKELKPEVADLLIGTQACLWTEFVNTPQQAEYLIFPRLTAFAERAWSGTQQMDWKNYLIRLDALLLHYDVMGVNYASSMFNLDHQVKGVAGRLEVTLSSIRPDVEIRYTTDELDPIAYSPLYSDPLELNKDTEVRALTFLNGQEKGQVLTLDLRFNKATAKTIEGNNKNLNLLINGLKGSDKQSDLEWCGWYGENATFVVDMWNVDSIKQIRLGTILNYGMGAHLPKSVVISASEDGTTYREIARKQYNAEELFKTGIETGEIEFSNLDAVGRYLKVEAENPGKCPTGHVREEQPSWIYFDEIEVK